MTWELYTAFLFSVIIVSALPGPTLILVIHYAIMRGTSVGRYTISAVIAGDVVAIGLSFIGIEYLLNISPNILEIVKTGGGLYILILGILNFRRNVILHKFDQQPIAKHTKKIFWHVFLVTAFNPKTILFTIAFAVQFIDHQQGNTNTQMLIMAVTYIIAGVLATVLYHFAASKINKLMYNRRNYIIVNLINSLILCSLGLVSIF